MNGERRSTVRLALLVLALLLAGFLGLEFLRAGAPPAVRIESALKAIGRRTPVRVHVAEARRGLRHVKVEFVQGERSEVVAEKAYPVPPAIALWRSGVREDTLSFEVGRETIRGLKAGHASIRVTAAPAGTWLRRPPPVSEVLILPVRLAPPALEVLSTKTYVAQGGCEVVVYRVGEGAVRDGVQSGGLWFPGYPLPGGGPRERFAFWAVPYTQASPDARLVAEDDAQNRAEAAIVDRFFARPLARDTVELTDSFMNKVVAEIMAQTPDLADRGGLLENYLAINGELRRRQDEELRALAARSEAAILWHRPFLPLPNGKVMALFAQRRTYVYQGRPVDEQDHTGYDLAATQRAPVPAANSGRVLLARYFGIYGNTVIIDHGCGLMSLYGHLSSVAVQEGQQVERGDIIGRTGQTGLAGGDHLHYAMLLGGLPVNPIEWWDAHWIGDRVAAKLGAAWRFEP